MAVFRLDCAYEGTGFHGFARQTGLRTVQGEIETALARVIGRAVPTVGAGRTDAGVHARNQVVSFQTGDELDTERLARSLTHMLAPEIVVHRAALVDDGFDARFSARARVYRYRVLDGPSPDPLRHRTTWHVPDSLDVDAMRHAVSHLVGEHDFASFCRRRKGATTVRTVLSADWTRQGDLAVLVIEARAFCHQMVRSIVGLSVEVGRRRRDASAVSGIVAARDRGACPQIAPPHGLVLWDVHY